MGQHNDDTALQRETSVCVSGLGELSVHVGQGVEMRVELRYESPRPLKPER